MTNTSSDMARRVWPYDQVPEFHVDGNDMLACTAKRLMAAALDPLGRSGTPVKPVQLTLQPCTREHLAAPVGGAVRC